MGISLETLALAKKYTDEHDGRGEEITVASSGAATINITANKIYVLNGAVTTLTLNAPASYNSYDEFYVMFTTGANGCTVLPPSGWTYLDGSVESFEPNTLYEFDAINGKIACPKGTVVS